MFKDIKDELPNAKQRTNVKESRRSPERGRGPLLGTRPVHPDP